MSKAVKGIKGITESVAGIIPGIGSALASRDAAKAVSSGVREAQIATDRAALAGGRAIGVARGSSLANLSQQSRIAEGRLRQISEPGLQAFDAQAALSGALGNDAQRQAFEQFSASPEQQFIRDQQEQAILRNASATGGLGGSRVLEALQGAAAGRASQNISSRFSRLGQVASQGVQAQTNIANLRQQLGINRASAFSGAGTSFANLAVGQGSQAAEFQTALGDARAASILGTQAGLERAGGLAATLLSGGAAGALSPAATIAPGAAGAIGLGGGIGL